MDQRVREAAANLFDYWTPLMLHTIVELGVVTAFRDDRRTAEDVAEEVGCDANTLHRVLRALAARGLFEERHESSFTLTPLGRFLLPEHPESVAHMARYRPWDLHAWAEFLHTLLTGKPAFPSYFGSTYFEYLSENPEASATFNGHMERRTRIMLDAALPLLDELPETGTVVDVGGGNGLLLTTLLSAHPGLGGIVFDLPHVVPEAEAALAAAGLADRASVVGGDFFVEVPADHDIYVLANILHDWGDDDAVAILERCRKAMPPTSQLVLFEAVLRGENEADIFKAYDLHMLVLLGGRERTQSEWEDLLSRAGFALDRVVPTPGLAWLRATPV